MKTSQMPHQVIRAWNSGLSYEEAKKLLSERHTIDIDRYWQILEQRYGCASIPLKDMYSGGFRSKSDLQICRERHWNLPMGERLKAVIAQANEGIGHAH